MDPDELLCDIFNRKGQRMNVPYIHKGVCSNIKEHKLCLEKIEEPGLAVVRGSNSSRWERVVVNNKEMKEISPDCLPPIILEKANKSTFMTCATVNFHNTVGCNRLR